VSKKPLHLRRAQLLKHLLLPLLQSIATHTSVLLRCPVGSKIVLETILESYRQLHPQSSSQQLKAQLQQEQEDQQAEQNDSTGVGGKKGKRKKPSGPIIPLEPLQIDINKEELAVAVDNVFKAIKELLEQPLTKSEDGTNAVKSKSKNKKKEAAKEENEEKEEEENDGKENGEEEEGKKESAPVESHILEDLVGHFTIKRLLLNLQPNGSELAVMILKTLQKTNSLAVAASVNRAAFVVAAALEVLFKSLSSQSEEQGKQGKKRSLELEKSLQTLEVALKPLSSTNMSPGSKVLAKAISSIRSKLSA